MPFNHLIRLTPDEVERIWNVSPPAPGDDIQVMFGSCDDAEEWRWVTVTGLVTAKSVEIQDQDGKIYHAYSRDIANL